MTRCQFIGMIMTAIVLTSIASFAYLLSHRYQTSASHDFLYVFDSFTGDVSTYMVAGEGQTFENLRLHEIGR
jgi:hypothetical protein